MDYLEITILSPILRRGLDLLRLWTKRGFYRYFAPMQDLLQTFISWDRSLSHWINGTGSTSLFDVFFPIITDLHHTWPFKFIFIPLLLALILFRRRKEGIFISLGLLFSLGLADFTGSLLKHFFQRRRPFELSAEFIQRSAAGGFSFPSNHAINMFCLAFFLTPFFPKFRWPLLAIAILVGYSRIYNGVHFSSDVIAGALLGGTFGFLGSYLAQKGIRRLNFSAKGKFCG